jgi:hypothetical protein
MKIIVILSPGSDLSRQVVRHSDLGNRILRDNGIAWTSKCNTLVSLKSGDPGASADQPCSTRFAKYSLCNWRFLKPGPSTMKLRLQASALVIFSSQLHRPRFKKFPHTYIVITESLYRNTRYLLCTNDGQFTFFFTKAQRI